MYKGSYIEKAAKGAMFGMKSEGGGHITPEEKSRIISDAKTLLIVRMGMTEEQAHKYLQKSSMDKCVPKYVAAQSVIDDNSDFR